MKKKGPLNEITSHQHECVLSWVVAVLRSVLFGCEARPFASLPPDGLIRFRSVCLYDLYPAMQHQHLICVERGSSLIRRTFCGRINSIFFSSLQLLRWSDAGGVVILLDQSSKFTSAVTKSGTFARLPDGPHLLRTTDTPEVDMLV
jgi:hypothetical protein